MKKILGLIILLNLIIYPAFASTRYKGLYFSDVINIYKYNGLKMVKPKNTVGVIAIKNDDIDYYRGATIACKEIGMRLPQKNEVPIVFEYLRDVANYELYAPLWLQEEENGQVYLMRYSGGTIQKNRKYEISKAKRPDMSLAICVNEAPPMTDKDRIEVIKRDYKQYKTNIYYGYENIPSIYGNIKQLSDEYPMSMSYLANKRYLDKIVSNLKMISNSTDNLILKNFIIEVNPKDIKKLSPETMKAIEKYNELMVMDDKQ